MTAGDGPVDAMFLAIEEITGIDGRRAATSASTASPSAKTPRAK